MRNIILLLVCILQLNIMYAQTYDINNGIFGTYTTTNAFYSNTNEQPKELYNISNSQSYNYGIATYADMSGNYDVYCDVCGDYLGTVTVTKTWTGRYKINANTNFILDFLDGYLIQI